MNIKEFMAIKNHSKNAVEGTPFLSIIFLTVIF